MIARVDLIFLTYFYSFIYLAALGVSWGMQDLVPWPGIEPGPPTLGVKSLTHWPTGGIPRIDWKKPCVSVTVVDGGAE